MKSVLIALMGLALLAGCAAQPRTEAPAPVQSSRTSGPVVAPKPISKPIPKPKPKTVQVYGYNPHADEPPAPPPELEITDGSGAAGSMDSLPSEYATPRSDPTATGPEGQPSATAGPAAAGDTAPAPELIAYAAPPPPMPELTPAASALAAQAESQRKAGEYAGAAATLERALRIQPQEAYLYNRLARVRLDQGRLAQAGNFARRANTLAGDQVELKKDNWGMIAVARRARGDVAGAEKAEARARGE